MPSSVLPAGSVLVNPVVPFRPFAPLRPLAPLRPFAPGGPTMFHDSFLSPLLHVERLPTMCRSPVLFLKHAYMVAASACGAATSAASARAAPAASVAARPRVINADMVPTS